MKTAYCFDLDGTLTSTEILPCIAAEMGISEEISTLTRLTMDGLITFAQSLRLRVAILGQVPVRLVHDVIEDIQLDQRLLSFISDNIDRSFIVTGNLDLWVAPIINRVGCDGFTSMARSSGAGVVLDAVLDKGWAVSEIRRRGFQRVVAIGDGSNDVPMFKASDISIAYGGVHSPTGAAVNASNYVLHDGDVLCQLLSSL